MKCYLECIVDQTMNSFIPMRFWILVKRWEHNWQNDLDSVFSKPLMIISYLGMVLDQTDEVFVIPIVQRSFCHLVKILYLGAVRRQKTFTVPTWKCGEETHLASWLNKGVIIFENSECSITSKISSSSLRNITSFGECVFGQYFSRPVTTTKSNIYYIYNRKCQK